MQIKLSEINNLNLVNKKFFLFYGQNDESKKEQIKSIKNNLKIKKVSNHNEKEVIQNKQLFFESILSKSFFDSEKIIIINYATDKIIEFIKEIYKYNLNDITFILNSDQLDKRSKLRIYFEKNKDLVCVPFYPDTNEILLKYAIKFIKDNKISVSQLDLNFLINRCNNQRSILMNELEKIKLFSYTRKINSDDLLRLTNLIENHSLSKWVDCCLAKNRKKAIEILNENNFNEDDGIIILKILSTKLKKLQLMIKNYELSKDLNKTILLAKPPIFWKDKEITKIQIKKWNSIKIKKLIFKLNDVELLIKKNLNNSLNIISDFMIKLSAENSNNSL